MYMYSSKLWLWAYISLLLMWDLCVVQTHVHTGRKSMGVQLYCTHKYYPTTNNAAFHVESNNAVSAFQLHSYIYMSISLWLFWCKCAWQQSQVPYERILCLSWNNRFTASDLPFQKYNVWCDVHVWPSTLSILLLWTVSISCFIQMIFLRFESNEKLSHFSISVTCTCTVPHFHYSSSLAGLNEPYFLLESRV